MSYDWKVAPMQRDGTMPKPQGGYTLSPVLSREDLFAGLMLWRYMMWVHCSYCDAFIKQVACNKEQDGQKSSGICDKCWPRACREFGLPETTPKPTE